MSGELVVLIKKIYENQNLFLHVVLYIFSFIFTFFVKFKTFEEQLNSN